MSARKPAKLPSKVSVSFTEGGNFPPKRKPAAKGARTVRELDAAVRKLERKQATRERRERATAKWWRDWKAYEAACNEVRFDLAKEDELAALLRQYLEAKKLTDRIGPQIERLRVA